MLTVDFDRMGVAPGDRVLDLGCGAGRHAFELYRRGARVVALDRDRAELDAVASMFQAMQEAGEAGAGGSAGSVPGDALDEFISPTGHVQPWGPPDAWARQRRLDIKNACSLALNFVEARFAVIIDDTVIGQTELSQYVDALSAAGVGVTARWAGAWRGRDGRGAVEVGVAVGDTRVKGVES